MLSKQKMLAVLDGLVAEAERVYKQFINDLVPWRGEFAAWLKASEATIEAIFGSTSEALRSFKNIYYMAPPGEQYANGVEKQKGRLLWFASGLRHAISTLKGYKYAVAFLGDDEPVRHSPFIFISHGGQTRVHVDGVRDFLAALGLLAIIVSDQPNLNLSVNEKVLHYMSLCSGGIALATAEDETTAKETRTRPNVENEIGMMQTAPNIGSRIIYLKESEVKFASNYKEKAWILFKKEHVEVTFTHIARELRAFRFFG